VETTHTIEWPTLVLVVAVGIGLFSLIVPFALASSASTVAT
jgi:hypothetical protein